mgnify:CR=1 FL=1
MENNANKHTEIIKVAEILKQKGVDFKRFKRVKTEKDGDRLRRKSKTLEDLANEYPNINMNLIYEEFDIDENYEIGSNLIRLENDINSRNCDSFFKGEEIEIVLNMDIVNIKRKSLTGQKIGQASFGVTVSEMDKASRRLTTLKERKIKESK